ncbi:alpha/beta hydrolase [Actinomadura barringtoniae]|uniref:alpha/beta hydrolase n=1 Tax=Actinomadura barringtoniae TaxID=1427535 RepID=UPI0027DE87E4|nr:alpha/beta hydrolase [Actinomadura barringtoniae]
MRRLVLITAAVSLGLTGTAAAAPRSAPAAPSASSAPSGAESAAAVGRIAWAPCPDGDKWQGSALKGLECGTLQVPLDYRKPNGKKLKLALTRSKATDTAHYQGIVLLNRGGPGGAGRDLPLRFTNPARGLPREVSAKYDWIGFDPRGVQASEPSLICDPSYQWPGHARADFVPRDKAEENAWLRKAKKFATDCGRRYKGVLQHIKTENVARDMDAIRKALGQRKTSYFGYSYGTFLGQVYASMFPTHVRRIVLDSVVNPARFWYGTQLDQNVAVDKNMKRFFAWMAKYDSLYHLGKNAKAVERKYYQGRAKAKRTPINGQIGPSEWDDFFANSDGYRNYTWIDHAKAISDYVVKNDPAALLKLWAPLDDAGQNFFSVYSAVQCRDAAWPKNWKTWHRDFAGQQKRGIRAFTWYNAWFNAQCAFWPTQQGPKPKIGVGKKLDSMLLLGATYDGATPFPGAVEAHRRFPTSRLLHEVGGMNHGISISPNADACANAYVARYFDTGALPKSRKGVDATCKASPLPDPTKATATTSASAAWDTPALR